MDEYDDYINEEVRELNGELYFPEEDVGDDE